MVKVLETCLAPLWVRSRIYETKVDVVPGGMLMLLSMATMGRMWIEIKTYDQQLVCHGEPVVPQPRLPTGHLVVNVRDVNSAMDTEELGNWSRLGWVTALEGAGLRRMMTQRLPRES